jgi:glycosyltransferase involved in cell wall biosynthesis
MRSVGVTDTRERAAKPHILFAGHLLHFLHPFIGYVRADGEYRVSIDPWQGHREHDEATSLRLAEAADIVFCEWCLGNALWYSRRKAGGQRLIIRLHRQEFYGNARTRYLSRVDWTAVDAAIVIAPLYKDLLAQYTSLETERIHYVPNLFDTEGFSRPKRNGALHNLGLVKYVRRKRPDLALRILEELTKLDSRFSLHVVGRRPEDVPWIWNRPEELKPVRRFLEAVRSPAFRDYVTIYDYTQDMPGWFSSIGFILSTSDNEGSHQAVAEGMAAGCVPVIRDWPGADGLYPRRFIFSTIDEAVQLIRTALEPERFRHLSGVARRWARSRFDTRTVAPQLLSLFGGTTPDR